MRRGKGSTTSVLSLIHKVASRQKPQPLIRRHSSTHPWHWLSYENQVVIDMQRCRAFLHHNSFISCHQHGKRKEETALPLTIARIPRTAHSCARIAQRDHLPAILPFPRRLRH